MNLSKFLKMTFSLLCACDLLELFCADPPPPLQTHFCHMPEKYKYEQNRYFSCKEMTLSTYKSNERQVQSKQYVSVATNACRGNNLSIDPF